MPQWLSRLRDGNRQGGATLAVVERPAPGVLELPPDLPAGVDGALWQSWAARWQEF